LLSCPHRRWIKLARQPSRAAGSTKVFIGPASIGSLGVYDVINDNGGRFGSLPGIPSGADQIGFGVGVIHVFNMGLLGTPPPPK
jgi:hypothetical protein